MTEKSNKTVYVFGTFDILHDGHRHFLKEASKLGDKLVVVVAPDSSVESLKGFRPYNGLTDRINNLLNENLATEVIKGDEISESWEVFKHEIPNVVAVGYDQKQLENSLRNYMEKTGVKFDIAKISPLKDGGLHSSVLRKKIV